MKTSSELAAKVKAATKFHRSSDLDFALMRGFRYAASSKNVDTVEYEMKHGTFQSLVSNKSLNVTGSQASQRHQKHK